MTVYNHYLQQCIRRGPHPSETKGYTEKERCERYIVNESDVIPLFYYVPIYSDVNCHTRK